MNYYLLHLASKLIQNKIKYRRKVYPYLQKKNVVGSTTGTSSKTSSQPFNIPSFGGQTQEEFIGKENATRIKSESAKPLRLDTSKGLKNTDLRNTIEKDLSSKRAQKLEEKGTDIMNSLGVGVNDAYAGISKIPRYIFESFGVPQNLLADAVQNAAGEDLLSGVRTTGKEYDTLLGWMGGNNPLANSPLTALDKLGDYFKGNAEAIQEKQTKYDKGIYDSLSDGNFTDAGSQIINNIFQSAPSLLTMATTSGLGNSANLGLLRRTALSTLPFASSKANEIRDDDSIPQAIKPIYSGMYGLAEVIYDQSFGTQALINKLLATATSSGRQVAEREARDFAKGYLSSAFAKIKEPLTDISKNAIDEMATTFSQNLLDKIVVDTDKDLMEGVLDAGIVGGAMGGALTSVNMVLSSRAKQKIEAGNQEIEQLSNDLENPALPESSRDIILETISEKKTEINEELNKEKENFSKLTEVEKDRALEISASLNDIDSSLNNEEISENSKTALNEQKSLLENELSDLTSKSTPSTKATPQELQSIYDKLDAAQERFLVLGQTEREAEQSAINSITDAERETLLNAYRDGVEPSSDEVVEETINVAITKPNDVIVGDAVELVDGKKGKVQSIDGESITIELANGRTLKANPKMVEIFKKVSKPIEATEQVQEIVSEPNVSVNEETVSTQEVPVVEETAQDVEAPNEVLTKAETDLEALKQVNNKNAKYDASIKRLTEAKNSGLITESEFNEQKKRFDDVLRESLPKSSNITKEEAIELNTALEEDGLTIDDIVEYESTEQQARLNQEVVQQPQPNITGNNGAVDTDKGKQAEKTEEVKKGGTDANEKSGTTQMDVGEQTTDGERMGEGDNQRIKPSKEATSEQVQGNTEEKVTGITQAATANAREQMGIEAYEKVSQTNEQRRAKAEQAIKDGYNVKQLLADIKSNEDYVPSRQEMEILKIYESSLDAAINKNPTSELLAERTDLLRTVDVGTSRAGAALQAVAGLEASVDNLSNFLTQEAIAHGVDRLPQSVIDKLRKEYEKGQDAKKAYEEGYEKAKQELVKAQAENELSKTRANRPSVKKSKADYVSERDELKKSIKDKLKRARGQLNAAPVPYLNELIAIAPDVAKLVKSYVEEGISKLDDIVKRVHQDLEEEIDGITEQDVIDLISGQYNQKRPTKNDILAQVRDLREEAKLLKKIDDLESGKIPSDPIKQIRRNADLEKLRKQIKDLEDEVGVTEAKTIKSRRTALENKIKKLQEDLELGNFDLEAAQPRKVRLDAETQKKQDEYIAFLKETNRRRDQAMYEQQSMITKAWLKFQQVLGLKRLIQTSIDFSMPFRQAVTVTLNPRYVPTTLKAFGNMFKSTFSEKKYDRIMFDIQQDPLYQDMRIDGLMFSEVDSKDNLKREEDFRTSFIYQIPYLREPFLASNRAAAGYINTARYNLYLKGVERLRSQGITHENSPENYEALAKWVMNMTGRGNLLSFMEKGENASKWQRIMGDTFYGTRLMASRFNMLNPNYYIKMPKEQRVEALKDIGSYVGLSAAVAFAAIAAGASVSTDPEDADFLKAKWGNKRYDLFTGGMNTYLRTAYRLMKAIYQRTNPKLYGQNPDTKELKKANKYGAFALKSGTDFFRYKLAPNTSYVLSAVTGKDPLGRPFNPNDIVAFYPMYVDDLREASKKDDAFMESMSILAPSLFGIGVQEYDNKK